jgi:CelD/BcsL family acetyltransferase involved in cellulose biosynthesis
MHRARWTTKAYMGSFSSESFINFHNAMTRRALHIGNLRLYYLKIGTEVAAVEYDYRIADCVQCYQIGWDERWAKYSLGNLMLVYVIEQSIKEGARRCDLLEGESGHKMHWATHIREDVRLRMFSPHWRGKVASFSTQGVVNLMCWVRQYVPKEIYRPVLQVIQAVKLKLTGSAYIAKLVPPK